MFSFSYGLPIPVALRLTSVPNISILTELALNGMPISNKNRLIVDILLHALSPRSVIHRDVAVDNSPDLKIAKTMYYMACLRVEMHLTRTVIEDIQLRRQNIFPYFPIVK